MASRRGFLSKAYTAARKAGLPDAAARVAASQAALESNYGKSAPGNNFFGIKAGKSWKGTTQRLNTWEVENGVKTPIKDTFRKYESFEQSFKDWAKLVAKNWPGVLTAETFEDAAAALKAGLPGGYATDPDYAAKLGMMNNRITDAMAFNLPDQMQAPKTLAQTLAVEAVAKAYQDPMRALDTVPARMSPTPPGNFAGPPSVSPIGSAPVGKVTRAPLGPVQKTYGQNLREAYAKTDALGLLGGGPTMAPSIDPSRFGGATISHLTSQTNAVRPSFGTGLPAAPSAPALSPVATRPSTPAVTGLPATRMQTAVMSRPATPSVTGLPSAPDRSVTPSNPGQLGGVSMSNPQGMGGPGGMYVGSPPTDSNYSRVQRETLSPETLGTAPSTAALAAQYGQYRTPTNYQQVREKMQAVPAAIPATPPPALVAPPAAVLAPALAPPQPVSNMSVASIPSAPRATAADVYSGLSDQGYDSVGNSIGRLSNGTTTVTNQYGATTGMTPGGYQTAVGNSLPGISAPSMNGIGTAVKGALPGMAGSAIGGALAGPLGALAGGLLARALTQPGGPLSNQVSYQTNAFGQINAAKPSSKGGFPSAPSGGYGTGGRMGASFSNNSMAGMRSMSPGAAAAIGAGKGGLY